MASHSAAPEQGVNPAPQGPSTRVDGSVSTYFQDFNVLFFIVIRLTGAWVVHILFWTSVDPRWSRGGDGKA